jgi:hypothetical protein
MVIFMQNLMQFWRSTLVAAAATALPGLPAAAQEAIGMKLEAAGFVMREANTPKKLERLRSVPPHKFLRRVKNGTPYYVYADPTYCKCALIGSQAAMTTYRDMVKPITPPPGYRDFAGNISGSDSVERDMIYDMQDDGEIGMDDDLFHPGF